MTKRWGNVLSPYWAARVWALLNGLEFKGRPFGRGTWMEFLPSLYQPDPTLTNPQAAQQICSTCNWLGSLEFFHECFSGWPAVLPAIQRDTRTAIAKFAEKQNLTIPLKGEKDSWYIYDRCEICAHSLHAPYRMSLYKSVLPKGKKIKVYYLPHRSGGRCQQIQDLRNKYIRKHVPNAEIIEVCQKTKNVTTPSHRHHQLFSS
jgi:hypothetical protein